MSVRKVCVLCGKRKGDDQTLFCAETGCPVALHVKCLPHEPKFDQSGKYFCPYCSYRRATAKVDEMKKKAILAKQALVKFLGAGVANGGGKEQTKANASASGNGNQGDDVVVPPKEAATPAKRGPCPEEEMADAEKSSPLKESAKRVKKAAVPYERRQRMNWTVREEELLQEAVQRFSDGESKNLPWRKILEFGAGTFDSTRRPMDLKDKWRNMQKKHMMYIIGKIDIAGLVSSTSGRTNLLDKEPVEGEDGKESSKWECLCRSKK